MYMTINKDAVTGEVTVHNWTQEEIDARKARLLPIHLNNLRQQRNILLAESDVYVLPDRWGTYDDAKKLEWSTYRQALRDLPANTVDPANPVWPVKPS